MLGVVCRWLLWPIFELCHTLLAISTTLSSKRPFPIQPFTLIITLKFRHFRFHDVAQNSNRRGIRGVHAKIGEILRA